MNRGVVFFIGLLFGILICGMLYYFDIKIFESKYLPFVEKEIITHLKTDTVYVEPVQKPKKQLVENLSTDSSKNSIDTKFNDDTSIYETTFSLDGDELDEIFSDQLLKTRVVKVKSVKQDIALPENAFPSFEIQQWSTPIKNKITYQRSQNMLRVKGMEINNMNIVFLDNVYYLEVNNRYYSIPETERFEKLTLLTIPQ